MASRTPHVPAHQPGGLKRQTAGQPVERVTDLPILPNRLASDLARPRFGSVLSCDGLDRKVSTERDLRKYAMLPGSLSVTSNWVNREPVPTFDSLADESLSIKWLHQSPIRMSVGS